MREDYLTVINNTEISNNIYDMVLECKDMPVIKAGQFINIYPKNETLTLPRPISVCDVNGNSIRIIYEVVGCGTKEFSSYSTGDIIKVLYPLGNGFTAADMKKNHVLIAGSLGAAPLLLLAKTLKGRISVFLGFKENPVIIDDFKKITENVYVATEIGGVGEAGTVIDILRKHDKGGQAYYACGPMPMLKAVCSYLDTKGVKGKDGQISVEARMACGFGVCVGCAVKIKDGDNFKYLKACSDGPVFNYKEVLWD